MYFLVTAVLNDSDNDMEPESKISLSRELNSVFSFALIVFVLQLMHVNSMKEEGELFCLMTAGHFSVT